MLKSLELINFKCYTKQLINFGKLTLFAGENASGKSSLIQSILLLSQVGSEKIEIKNKKTIQCNFIKSKKEVVIGEIKLNDVFNMHLGALKEIRNINATTDSIAFNVAFFNQNKTSMIEIKEVDGRAKYILDSDDKEFKISRVPIKYLYAERIGPRMSQNINNIDELHVGYQGEYVNQVMLERLDDSVNDDFLIQKKYVKDIQDTFLAKQVQHWLDFITPGIELFPKEFSDLYMTSMGIRRKGFTDNFLNPYNIGFGVTYVLPIIVNCLICEPEDIIVIENPEAHLHPRAQTNLGIFLAQIASAGVQVVIETHSDHLIDGVRRSVVDEVIDTEHVIINFNSVVTKKYENNVIVEQLRIDNKGEIDHWPNGFMSQKATDMDAILRGRLEKRRQM